MNEIRSRSGAEAGTLPRDAADYLEDLDDVVAYLEAAFEDGDPRIIAATLGSVARSGGMTAVAARLGLGRESLYKALSGDGKPALATVLGAMIALGLRLRPLAPDRGSSAPAGDDGTGWSSGFALPRTDLYVRSGGSAAHPARRASEYR